MPPRASASQQLEPTPPQPSTSTVASASLSSASRPMIISSLVSRVSMAAAAVVSVIDILRWGVGRVLAIAIIGIIAIPFEPLGLLKWDRDSHKIEADGTRCSGLANSETRLWREKWPSSHYAGAAISFDLQCGCRAPQPRLQAITTSGHRQYS